MKLKNNDDIKIWNQFRNGDDFSLSFIYSMNLICKAIKSLKESISNFSDNNVLLFIFMNLRTLPVIN